MDRVLKDFLLTAAKKKAGMKDQDKKGKEDYEWTEKDKEDWEKEGWGEKDGWMSKDEFADYIEEWKWWVQLIFTFIAAGNAAKLGMEFFRYRRPSDYYVNGKLGADEFNWWELGNNIFLQGGFYIMATATVTQLLSLFGVMPMLNFYVWELAVFGGIGILTSIYGWMSWKTYDEAYSERRNRRGDKTAAQMAAGKAAQYEIQVEWNAYAIEEIFSIFSLYPLIPYWYAAMGMCEGWDIEEWHERCPEDWQKDVWEMAHHDREEGRDAKKKREAMERRKKEEWEKNRAKKEKDVWEVSEDEEPEETEEPENKVPDNNDENIDDPVDPFTL